MQHLQPNATLQGGKYRIERVLGQGGFGNTYMAFNTEFEETVAIKEFFMKGVTERDETTSAVSVSNAENVAQFEEQREKFKKEARRLRKLKNEHIVKVHDLFEENGTAYYVMDFIDGESLSERLKRTGLPLTEQQVCNILKQVLEALKEVHQNEIWHLDIKPGNIMLDQKGQVYLIDFGASKQIRAGDNVTTSTALCYTPGYAPNEQVGQMFDRFGPWTDIYALGATAYNLLTNQKPPMAIDIEEDGDEAFSFPANISEKVRHVVVWMMKQRRKERPQCVDEILMRMDYNTPIVDATDTQENYKEEKDETLLLSHSTPIVPLEKENCHGNILCIDDNEEPQTILIISKKGQVVHETTPVQHILPQRAIKVGDFIFDDGAYSDVMIDNKSVVGVLFSKYGGAHGQIVTSISSKEHLTINGKELKWHKASIGEWVEIINNFGSCKVTFNNGEYKYYSLAVRKYLVNHFIAESKYLTRESVAGVSYIVNLDMCTMTPLQEVCDLPYIYVAEF